tara:strand:- start:928 stop:1173 length:246 start_codon:yes stop_codon:yes gene_type:complete
MSSFSVWVLSVYYCFSSTLNSGYVPEKVVGFLMNQRLPQIEFCLKSTTYVFIDFFATVFSTTGRLVSILETAINSIDVIER